MPVFETDCIILIQNFKMAPGSAFENQLLVSMALIWQLYGLSVNAWK